MMKLLSIATVLAATTAPAAADEPIDHVSEAKPAATPGYVSLGTTAGLESVLYLGFVLEGGARLGATPLYLHGQVERGLASTWLDSGTYQSYRLGLEARTCTRRFNGCVFGGVDGGVRRAQLMHDFDSGAMMEDRVTNAIVVPRVGAEVGTHVKARVAVEVPTVFDNDETLAGVAIVAGVGYAF